MDISRPDTERYQAIVAEVRADLERWAATLERCTRPFFDRLVEVQFSRVVALLPSWLSDLLEGSPTVCYQLGVAHLYGWWFYYAQDELLDGDAPPATMLGAHVALLRMAERYRALGLDAAPLWPKLI